MTLRIPLTCALRVGFALACLSSAARVSALTIVFVTTSNGSYNAEETAKRNQFQSWGHTVNALWDAATQATYDSSLASADLVYVSKDATPGDVSNKLRTASVGVVFEQYQLDDELGFSTSDGATTSQTQINLVDPAYGSGLVAIFNSSQPETYLQGTVAAGYRNVGQTPGGQMALGLLERGSTLANTVSGNNLASGRRLRLPWGGSTFVFSSLSAVGLATLQSGLVWAGEKPLLLHWKLDAASGTSAADASTYGRTGTVSGSSSWIAGRRKNAFDFNGSTRIETTTTLNNPTNFTIACWAHIDAADSGGAEGLSVGDYILLRMHDSAGGPRGAFFAGGSTYRTVTISKSFVNRGWHHFAVTFDDVANSLKLYVDGELMATTSTPSSITWSGLGTKTVAGMHGNGGSTHDLDGALDDIRVYNYALPPGEIAEVYGLLGNWNLTETSGTAATDSSSKGANGTYTNGPVLAQPGPYPGAGQYAASLDGSNDYVDVAAATNYTFPEGFSVAGWVYLNAYLNNAAMLENGSTTETCALAFSASGQVRVSGRSSGGVQSLTSSSVLPLNRWQHVVGTYDGTTFRVYINGQLDVIASNTFTVSTPSGNLTLGASLQGTDEFLNGRLHDVRLYNRAIGSDEVASLFGLIRRWKLDETSGTVAADSSGSGIAGTYASGPIVGQAGPYPGAGAYAPTFDGADDHVVAGNVQEGLASGFSVAVWARPTSVGSWQRFLDFGNGADTDNIYFGRENATNDFRIAIKDGSLGNTQLIASGSLELNMWRHYVATCDSNGNGVLYRDGQVVASGTLGTPGDVTRTINYIARSNWPADDNYAGQLHDVRLYNRPLSATEAAELYGLVGHWKFNEGAAGTTIADSTNQGTNAAFSNGAPTWVSGIYGSALSFNGSTDDAITSAKFAPPNVGTVAYWFRSTGVPAAQQRHLGLGGDWEIWQNPDGILRFDLSGDGEVGGFRSVSTPIAAGNWYHLVAMYDTADESYAIYINCALDKSGVSTSALNPQTAAQLSFGTRTGTTNRLNGTLDDCRVYNRKLSMWEVYQIFGEMAWYKLDETAGTVAIDSTGRWQDGSFSGGPTLNVTANGAASQGTAVAFNGSNSIQATGLYDKSSSVTATAWVRLDAADSGGAEVVSLGDCFYLRLDSGSNGLKAGYYNGSTYVTTTASQIVVNTGWHHVAAVLDGGTALKVYLDGVEVATTPTSGAISYVGQGGNTRIATHGNGGTNLDFTGRVDDVRIYNRALQPDEVFQFYRGSRINGLRILQWVEAR